MFLTGLRQHPRQIRHRNLLGALDYKEEGKVRSFITHHTWSLEQHQWKLWQMNPSHINGLGILVLWTHTAVRLDNKLHSFWNTRDFFRQDQLQLTSTYLEKGICNRWWRGRKWMNGRTSVVLLCNNLKETLWEEGMGRIRTLLHVPLCSHPLWLWGFFYTLLHACCVYFLICPAFFIAESRVLFPRDVFWN